MKNLIKFTLLFVLAIGMCACSDNDDNGNNGNNGGEDQPQTLLVKIESSFIMNDDPNYSDVSTTQLTYNDKNQLVKFVTNQTYGTSDSYTYNTETVIYYDVNNKLAGMLSTTAYSHGGSSGIDKDSSTVVVNTNGTIAKATFYTNEDSFASPAEILEYKWNNGKLIEIKNVLDDATYAIGYTNGNITQINSTYEGQTLAYTATFDNKKNFYSPLTEALIITFDELDAFIRCPEDNDILSGLSNNNITKSTLIVTKNASSETKEVTYTYEYNDDGYPTKRIATSSNGIETSIYTYEKK